ncbi:MAG: hypothetical protein GH145_02260 [Firmicutes bacterium]|jgi:hypothetical protein|nr:hypothetical protein [Bacillota bacterium]
MFKELLSKVFGVPARLYYSWKVSISLKILKKLHENMKKAHYPRYKSRQFWRDFVNSPARRQAIELSLRRKK